MSRFTLVALVPLVVVCAVLATLALRVGESMESWVISYTGVDRSTHEIAFFQHDVLHNVRISWFRDVPLAGVSVYVSPDWRYIAINDGDVYWEIYDWRSARQSSDLLPERAGRLRWSPDSRYIAYAADGIVIHAIDDLATAIRLTTTDPDHLHTDPAWSPDAARIAYVESVGTGTGEHRVFLVNVDDGYSEVLVQGMSAVRFLTWSPDGTQLAFAAYDDVGFNLFAVNTVTGDLRKVTRRSSNYLDPVWSPDGTLLAYLIYLGHSEQYSLYVQPLSDDGAPPSALAHRVQGVAPRWSPDGMSIVFSDWDTGVLFAVDLDGDRRRLTDDDLYYR